MGSELTIQQQQALALARARRRRAEAKSQAPAPSVLSTLGRRAAYAVPLGFGDEIRDIAAAGLASTSPLLTFPEAYKQAREATAGEQALDIETNPASAIIGDIGGSLLTGAAGAKAVGSMLGGGNLATRAGKGILAGGASGAVTGAGFAEDDKRLQSAIEGGLLGAAIGGAVPVVAAGAKRAVASVVPNIDRAQLEPAQKLKSLADKHNIPLSVSNLTTSDRYKRIVQQGKSLPLSGGEDEAQKVQVALNKAVTRTLGEESEKITPEYLDRVRKTLGDQFQSLTKGKEFTPTADAYTKIDEMANVASRKGYGMEGETIFKQYLNEFNSLIDDRGLIKGDKLDKFRRDLASVARRQSNSDIGQVASDFEDVVVDVISDSDKSVAKAISDMKYKYKNYKTVVGPASRSQATGDISPQGLGQSVSRVFGIDRYATGRAGDLGEIARVGQALRPPSSSGTAENILAQRSILEHAMRLPTQYVPNMLIQQIDRSPAAVNSMLRRSQMPVPYMGTTQYAPVPAGMLTGYLGAQ